MLEVRLCDCCHQPLTEAETKLHERCMRAIDRSLSEADFDPARRPILPGRGPERRDYVRA